MRVWEEESSNEILFALSISVFADARTDPSNFMHERERQRMLSEKMSNNDSKGKVIFDRDWEVVIQERRREKVLFLQVSILQNDKKKEGSREVIGSKIWLKFEAMCLLLWFGGMKRS